MRAAPWISILVCFAFACSSDENKASSSGGTGGTTGGGTGGTGGATGGMPATGGMCTANGGAPPLTPGSCADIPTLATGDANFKVTVAEYTSCGPIPAVHTCDAKPFPQGTSPTVSWTGAPAGTMSFAVVFKDLAVLGRYPDTDSNFNKGYHYVMWDIPGTATMLPANMKGGHLSTDVPGARQWSNFNDYAFFGPCPNFDATLCTDWNFTDTYAFVVYALPFTKATVPAPQMGVSSVRLMDNLFKTMALATAEYRGTSSAHASTIPAGVLPPTAKPPCPTDGSAPPDGCLMDSASSGGAGAGGASTGGASTGGAGAGGTGGVAVGDGGEAGEATGGMMTSGGTGSGGMSTAGMSNGGVPAGGRSSGGRGGRSNAGSSGTAGT